MWANPRAYLPPKAKPTVFTFVTITHLAISAYSRKLKYIYYYANNNYTVGGNMIIKRINRERVPAYLMAAAAVALAAALSAPERSL